MRYGNATEITTYKCAGCGARKLHGTEVIHPDYLEGGWTVCSLACLGEMLRAIAARRAALRSAQPRLPQSDS